MRRSRFARFFSSRYTAGVKGGRFLDSRRVLFFAVALLLPAVNGVARPPVNNSLPKASSPASAKNMGRQDDWVARIPAKDLMLQPESLRKAGALAQFVEGERWEELGEMEKA